MLYSKILEIIFRIDYQDTTDIEFKRDLDFARGVIGNYYDELTIKESHLLLRELQLLRDNRSALKYSK